MLDIRFFNARAFFDQKPLHVSPVNGYIDITVAIAKIQEFLHVTKGGSIRIIKQEKKVVKRQIYDSSSSSTFCKNCKKVGCRSMRSPGCSKYITPKEELLQENLGTYHNSFTRKLSLRIVIHANLQRLFKKKSSRLQKTLSIS
ncbi:hypothetical protein PHYBLDRAFT_63247 [Phycomyces blakesleeanus NRRL 1555(-)]|uniref:Uncharacterized protein n=1 Tax=Phycomyces blakesleeanus (strain ATCC 8743b / DSM 1359 / FGSC 10004 / NBRC 33097 / NRRL 1555) TaxID=763407 RepID=A0A162UNB9_PHYB8|nr:hypothetical protein PHYBLDRAFT_63247 [Phycomyces blakesleeanus NRRL 1555(-)]OAD76543.1 hypothetical protein PHYBLDRAFT_63247 [Phycomyces blakesleeanus NRRL 1555(-)]|eukprot:XP_018294583.1 hypothetical protein PHYBLDRAFT_63247 [Phycomyces blakesleeanus NRRL 1555(-)]